MQLKIFKKYCFTSMIDFLKILIWTCEQVYKDVYPGFESGCQRSFMYGFGRGSVGLRPTPKRSGNISLQSRNSLWNQE